MKKSAGLLVYRFLQKELQVLLVHPGGPFWKNKDKNAWSIPKGEFNDGEDALATAIREFEEETGKKINGACMPLGMVKRDAGKVVYAFAVEASLDVSIIQSNFFEMEWPPHSGEKQLFPETDKAAWFNLQDAAEKINAYQLPLLEALRKLLRL